MTVAALVRELQGELSQEELAAKLGITQAMVSALALGKRGMGRKVAYGMIRAFPDKRDLVLSLFFARNDNNRDMATTDDEDVAGVPWSVEEGTWEE